MTAERPPATGSAEFDAYAARYEEELSRGLRFTGEGRDFYARGRVEWLRRRLQPLGLRPRRVLDFGCGTGAAVRLLQDRLGAEEVLGLDPSEASLERARAEYGGPGVRFARPDDYQPDASFDLVFTNGVFHHVPSAQQPAAAAYAAAALRGGGCFALWENNPWNPGTRWSMRVVSFDRDAVPIGAGACAGLVRGAGLQVIAIDYLFVFPRFLRWLRPLEPGLVRLPLGGQYQVLGRKSAA